ncbi:hypothetical protein RHGRI_033148 [Rhododendron griersonianum]|uniref:Uncharacterized protein n=1 Tax=Rhododendron griersonianum TaxID=479676 RepID=A0AAV6HVJ7_9ERIC|nr:hypothetical protein RHGRI_033148 [Rhododendron griersonianum]
MAENKIPTFNGKSSVRDARVLHGGRSSTRGSQSRHKTSSLGQRKTCSISLRKPSLCTKDQLLKMGGYVVSNPFMPSYESLGLGVYGDDEIGG